MNIQSMQLEELECQVVDDLPTGKIPDLAVVLCHGYGAPGNDLVGLGPELLSRSENIQQTVQFLFPAAPLSLDGFGMFNARAWWHLDVMAISAAIQQGKLRDQRSIVPEGLPEARIQLMETVETYSRISKVPLANILLGGFSQGSMIATDVALRLEETPAGLAVFSGTLLMEEEWKNLAENRAELPVLQSHGMQDEILPYCGAEWLRDLLTSAGLNVDFVPFSGGHTIPHAALSKLETMITGLLER